MSDDLTTQAKFACGQCGRQFAWKPQLAGKLAKCKCGAVVKVPAAPPTGDEPDFDAAPRDEYDVADDAASGYRCPSCSAAMTPGSVVCLRCGFNVKLGRKMSTAVGGDDDDVAAPAQRPVTAMPAAASTSGGDLPN